MGPPPRYPNTAVPTGTASFGTSNTTSLSFSANTTIGGWTFNSGASNYSFTIPPNPTDVLVVFTGAGIVINGGSASITSNNQLRFINGSTAGSATITINANAFNSSIVEFRDTSTAGSARRSKSICPPFKPPPGAGFSCLRERAALRE